MSEEDYYKFRWFPYLGHRKITDPNELFDYGLDPTEYDYVEALVFEWGYFSFLLGGLAHRVD